MNETGLAVQQPGGDLMSVEQHRAIQEVQASMIIAKKFPRDVDAAYLRIMKACERHSLAGQAEYAYPRGGKTVTGPSIRLAEVIAQNWGNLQFGIRELSQSGGESEIEAFAWDIETNTRQIKTFKVPHKRYSKAKGNVDLTDPRDIYEYVANQGARRMRACILGIIPGDITESAIEKCRSTVKKGVGSKPLEDQIRVSLKRFDGIGVTKEMIERRLGHETNAITADELVELNNIGRSIQDNMTSREEWFDLKAESQKQAKDLTDKIKNGASKPPDPELETKGKEGELTDVQKTEIAKIGKMRITTIMAWGKKIAESGKAWIDNFENVQYLEAFLKRFEDRAGKDFGTWLKEKEPEKNQTEGYLNAIHTGNIVICPDSDGEEVTPEVCGLCENKVGCPALEEGGSVDTGNGDRIECPDKGGVLTKKAFCESNCDRGDDKCVNFVQKWGE